MAETKTTSTKGRKKATTTTTKPKTVKQTTQVDISAEASELEKIKAEKAENDKLLAQLQAQLNLLQSQLASQQSNGIVIKQNEDITRTVKVISMIENTYNLSTQKFGRGKVYTFNGFGTTHNIKFTDMQDILSIYGHQFEEGYAVLSDKKDYDDLGIGYIYDTVLDFDKMKKITNLESKEAVDIILNMSEDMQDRIVDIIATNIANGVSYDYNKIKKLEDNGLAITKVAEMNKTDTEETDTE